MNTEIIILLALMFAAIYLIYDIYKQPVNSKDFIVTIYLYVFVALLFIAVTSNYARSLNITNPENSFKLIITYFFLAFVGISMMFSDKFFVNHIGFLLLLLGLSIMISTLTKYADNVSEAIIITAIIVSILTAIVFFSSEESLVRMASWIKSLLWILVCVILIQLGLILFSSNNETFYKIMTVTIIILFGLFVLSDTSRLLLEGQNLTCQTHSCINYPLKSSALILNYVNLFIGILRMKQ